MKIIADIILFVGNTLAIGLWSVFCTSLVMVLVIVLNHFRVINIELNYKKNKYLTFFLVTAFIIFAILGKYIITTSM
ncbi:TPA: hypothetical protein VAR13_002108 [Streptococcus agalactiae]|nr:hypothetical protein [Streptococcus agalactiae]